MKANNRLKLIKKLPLIYHLYMLISPLIVNIYMFLECSRTFNYDQWLFVIEPYFFNIPPWNLLIFPCAKAVLAHFVMYILLMLHTFFQYSPWLGTRYDMVNKKFYIDQELR